MAGPVDNPVQSTSAGDPPSSALAASYQPDLADILALGLRYWGRLLVATLMGIALGVVLISTARPQYRTELVFTVVSDGGGGTSAGLARLAGSMGGLGALAGMTLGAIGGSSDQSLALLRSRVFAEAFIQKYDLMPVLFPSQWDEESGQWKPSATSSPPTMAAAIDRFQKLREITEDRRTGIVRLSLLWPDAERGAQLANAFVTDADGELRSKAIADAQRNIAYLQEEIAKSVSLETRQMLYGLLAEQYKVVSVGRTRQYFAFRVIDPAMTPDLERPAKPRRALILAVSTLAGFLAGAFLLALAAVFRAARKKM